MAQEREKRRIVIASVLKPVDDTRMYEKMGHSLAETNLYDVSIIGFAPSSPIVPCRIRQISMGNFPRLSFTRLWTRWRIFQQAFTLQPDVFIFTTHELILPAIALKVIRNTRIIYDVRENYFRNILHSEGLPLILRPLLAMLVRLKEKLTAPAIDYFFLAEREYEKEFKFHRAGWTVLENKALPNSRSHSTARGLRLLFSGTLASSTGVFRAIRLARQLHAVDPRVQLTIAGYAASLPVREQIHAEAESSPFVRLIGVDALVSHGVIAKLIRESDAGIIAYPSAPQTVNSVPTKLFEYLQGSLPILTEAHWPWIPRFGKHHPFVFCDFKNPDLESIVKALTTNSFYLTPATESSWQSEETKLLLGIKNIV